MKALLLLLFFMSNFIQAQPNSNSQSRLPVDPAEQQAFDEWNKEEQQARQREEQTRLLNEERARGFDPGVEKQEEEINVECKCPPPAQNPGT